MRIMKSTTARYREALSARKRAGEEIEIQHGGAFEEIKLTPVQKDQKRNTLVVKSLPDSPNPLEKTSDRASKKISDEKLKRFVNFRI